VITHYAIIGFCKALNVSLKKENHMSSILIVGGDKIQGIKNALSYFQVDDINHWSGRKVGDGNKVIPQDTQLIVLITNWISHKFTKKIKEYAAKRGLRIVYTPNGSAALLARLTSLKQGEAMESDCRKVQCIVWLKQAIKSLQTTLESNQASLMKV